MTFKKAHLQRIPLAIIILLLVSCTGTEEKQSQPANENEARILLSYLEENGDIINSAEIPFLINADEVHANLNGSNYHVVDVRSPRDFNRGHIAHAVNIQPENILDYFENRIEPNSFQKITIVCNDAHLSGYVAGILRFLGYDNVFNMRFGMSAWHDDIARRHWYANISDDLVGRLETTPHPKNEPGPLPNLSTGKNTGYEILRERAQIALELDYHSTVIDFMDILEGKEDYYLVNYWPEALYNQGHLPGAIQYDPKKAFHSGADIFTLPTDQPLVVYCYSGHHTVYVNAYLTLLGYEFRSLDYGVNAFTHQIMAETQPATRSFSAIHVRNYPLVRDGLLDMSDSRNEPAEKVEVTTVQGGC